MKRKFNFPGAWSREYLARFIEWQIDFRVADPAVAKTRNAKRAGEK